VSQPSLSCAKFETKAGTQRESCCSTRSWLAPRSSPTKSSHLHVFHVTNTTNSRRMIRQLAQVTVHVRGIAAGPPLSSFASVNAGTKLASHIIHVRTGVDSVARLTANAQCSRTTNWFIAPTVGDRADKFPSRALEHPRSACTLHNRL